MLLRGKKTEVIVLLARVKSRKYAVAHMTRARTRQIKASKIVFSLTELSRNHKKASELFFVKAVLRLNQSVKKRAELRLKSICGLFFKVASPKSITAVPLRLLMKFFTHKNHSKLAH